MENKIRKQNLQRLRSEYGESFRRALAEQGLTPEEFSAQSEIPLNVVEEHLNGQRRFLGEINNICFCLNKRMKIELVNTKNLRGYRRFFYMSFSSPNRYFLYSPRGT